MRNSIALLLVLAVLGGCSSSGEDAEIPTPTAEVTSESPSPTPEPTPEPTPAATDQPSDVETSRDGESIVYTLAGDELSLVLPRQWSNIVDTSKAFPVAVQNPENTQRIVIAEIGPARLTLEPEPYRELLVEQLDVDDTEVAYIGTRYAGDQTYPTFFVNTYDYAAWIFLVEADDRLFELTVKGDTYAEGAAALDLLETLQNFS